MSVRLFDRLYSEVSPGKRTGSHLDDLNPDSLEVLEGALIEPNWAITDAERDAGSGDFEDGIDRLQFERQGYFAVDGPLTDAAGRPVFNRAVSLKDSWANQSR